MIIATKSLSTQELSALYDRIYDIADRLFKKYNPCNIHTKNNKTRCMNKLYKHNYLCCCMWSNECKHSKNGCTIKCLACKLFMCSRIFYVYDKNGIQKINKKYKHFVNKITRLKRIVNRHGLSNMDYFLTKKTVLKRTMRQRGFYERHKTKSV